MDYYSKELADLTNNSRPYFEVQDNRFNYTGVIEVPEVNTNTLPKINNKLSNEKITIINKILEQNDKILNQNTELLKLLKE